MRSRSRYNFDQVQVSSVTMTRDCARGVCFICNNIRERPHNGGVHTCRRALARVNSPLRGNTATIAHTVRSACRSCLIGPTKVDHDLCTREILSHCADSFFSRHPSCASSPAHVREELVRARTQQDIGGDYKRREARIVKLRLCKSAITKTIRFSRGYLFAASRCVALHCVALRRER